MSKEVRVFMHGGKLCLSGEFLSQDERFLCIKVDDEVYTVNLDKVEWIVQKYPVEK